MAAGDGSNFTAVAVAVAVGGVTRVNEASACVDLVLQAWPIQEADWKSKTPSWHRKAQVAGFSLCYVFLGPIVSLCPFRAPLEMRHKRQAMLGPDPSSGLVN